MNLELNEVQAAMLTRELHSIIQNDRYPLGPRIVAPQGDPGAATAGVRTRAPATAAELRAAEQGAISETRLEG